MDSRDYPQLAVSFVHFPDNRRVQVIMKNWNLFWDLNRNVDLSEWAYRNDIFKLQEIEKHFDSCKLPFVGN